MLALAKSLFEQLARNILGQAYKFFLALSPYKLAHDSSKSKTGKDKVAPP
jgi:hypothetical protein